MDCGGLKVLSGVSGQRSQLLLDLATRSLKLASGDVVVLGGASRLAFHGVDRIYPGTSTLLKDWFPEGGRINLTLRRVTGAA